MAELNVESKKKTNYIPWILLLLGLLVLALILGRRSGKDKNVAGQQVSGQAVPKDTEVLVKENIGEGYPMGGKADSGWSDINRNAPGLAYAEFKTNKEIQVKGNSNYAVFDLGEDVLFDKDQSVIRSTATENLKNIASSIDNHFPGGQIRLYGFTDAQGNSNFNKALALHRAEAVKEWFVSHGQLDADRISMEAVGENSPIATNSTASGRKQNRRVQVIVRKSS